MDARLRFSPDKKTMLAKQDDRLVLLPIGPGQPVEVKLPPLVQQVILATFMPDGKSAVIQASEAGHPNRLHIGDFKTWRAFTPEGIAGRFVLAGDGSAAVARIGGEAFVFRTDGSGQSAIPGLTPDDYVVGWTTNPRELWVRQGGAPSLQIVDIITGKRRSGRGLNIPAGIQAADLRVTPDGKTYLYNYLETQSTLYVVRGLQ